MHVRIGILNFTSLSVKQTSMIQPPQRVRLWEQVPASRGLSWQEKNHRKERNQPTSDAFFHVVANHINFVAET